MHDREVAMAKRVMILGLRADFMEEFRRELDGRDIELVAGTGSVQDVKAAFAEGDFDEVFLGGGLSVETRLAVVNEIFHLSDRATVHMKDHRSGPEGYVPFVTAVLNGLADYHPVDSPNAIHRATQD
jgi:hypothetical protein